MSIYQHFRDEERVFIDTVLQWKDNVETYYSPKLTSFLDPREQQILAAVIGSHSNERNYVFFGGYENAERKRAFLFPDYYEANEEDFQLTLFDVSYNKKFHELRHQQILGTLMSLGIKREKFGDILISEQATQLIVANEISDYIEMNMTKIGQASVVLVRKELKEIVTVSNEWQLATTTCTSMRLDNVISTVANISRSKAQALILGSKVKINHTLTEKSDFECQQGDIISVRGLGRYRIMAIDGKTKKDKWRIEYGRQK